MRNILHSSRRWLWAFSKGLVIEAVLSEGTMIGSEERLRVLTVGSDLFIDEVRARIFLSEPVILRRWRVPFFVLALLVSKTRRRFDLCVAALPSSLRQLKAMATFEGQVYVTQVIDSSGGWEGVRGNLSRTKRNLVNTLERKFALGMRVTREESDFAHFYHRMYLPYAIGRFGGLAVIHSYKHLLGHFKDGGLLIFVLHEGSPVAAALCQQKREQLVFNCAGVEDGQQEFVTAGVFGAIYFFLLKYAIEHQIPSVDVQQSRPFLKDGVYDNKGRWGGVTFPSRDYSTTTVSYVFGDDNSRRKLAQLFERWPIIVRGDSGLHALIGYSSDDRPTEEQLRALMREYCINGLSKLEVITPKGHMTMALR